MIVIVSGSEDGFVNHCICRWDYIKRPAGTWYVSHRIHFGEFGNRINGRGVASAQPQQQKALVQSKDQHRLLVVFEIRLDNGEVYTVDNIMRETHGDGAVLSRCDFETSCYHRLPPVWPGD
jgi:hypothetical protein